MQDTESDSDFRHRINVGEARKVVAVYLVFAILAASVYAIAIVLIVVTKTYRQFIYRLRLYLAIAGCAHAVAIALEIMPADIANRPDNATVAVKSGWDKACTFFGAFGQYCSILQTLAIAWISFYVFMLITGFHERLKKRKYEVAGVVLVACVPALFTWEPFIGDSYGLTGTTCWIADSYERNSSLSQTLNIVSNVAPATLLVSVSVLLLVAANLVLVKNATKRDGLTRKQNWKAMRQLLPLMLYPIIYFLTYIVDSILIASRAAGDITDVIVVSLLQTCSFALLISLFLHSAFRSKCRALCLSRFSRYKMLESIVSETTVIRSQISDCDPLVSDKPKFNL